MRLATGLAVSTAGRRDPSVPVAAIFLLHHVAGRGRVGDDAVHAALGDTRADCDMPEPHTRVLGGAQQHPGVSGRETQAFTRRSYLNF